MQSEAKHLIMLQLIYSLSMSLGCAMDQSTWTHPNLPDLSSTTDEPITRNIDPPRGSGGVI